MSNFKFFLLVPLIGAIAWAAESPECKYNEFAGELTGQFKAYEPEESRAWVPLELRLCKNERGTYAIISHRAVGLGVLSNPPLKTSKYKGVGAEDPKIELLISNQEDDRLALKALESADIEAVLVAGTSATQVTVFRKELRRVYSNTLFKVEK